MLNSFAAGGQSELRMTNDHDVILIGSGIMSATLGVVLKSLNPALRVQLYEAAESLAPESSHGWNNAGTGHAGFCELTYTPHRKPDGTVDVSKAFEMFARFERSRQFWAHAVSEGMANDPTEFICQVPHISFVHGSAEVEFLRARYESLRQHPAFSGMAFSTDRATIAQWAPLLIEGRDPGQLVAATKVDGGTDVNFGALSRRLLGWLGGQSRCSVAANHKVTRIRPTAEGWEVTVSDLATGISTRARSAFVFVGAGGGTLALLRNAGVSEAKGFAGFPIGGQWLVCDNPALIQRHSAKAYGHAVGSTPAMGGPHLDVRVLDRKRALLFGPFASLTTKFLHRRGSWLDLFRSIHADNLATFLRIGAQNLPLIRYLTQQATQTMADRVAALREFYPDARAADWKLVDAGIRVQLIKPSDAATGVLNFGTEIVTSSNRTLAALLGASPGASVSADIALRIVKSCFADLIASPAGRTRLEAMFPTWNQDLTNPSEFIRYREAIGPSIDRTLCLRG